MSINKIQGQSLSRVELYLKEHVFSRGQFYVALSRVKSRDEVKLLILYKDGRSTNKLLMWCTRKFYTFVKNFKNSDANCVLCFNNNLFQFYSISISYNNVFVWH